jgi:hypothetical protein
MASLIQQRMAIDRQRIFGTLSIIVGGLFLTIAIVDLVTFRGAQVTGYLYLVLAVGSFVLGFTRRARSTRARRTFEAENGKDAGKQ